MQGRNLYALTAMRRYGKAVGGDRNMAAEIVKYESGAMDVLRHREGKVFSF